MPSQIWFRNSYINVRDSDAMVLLNVLLGCVNKQHNGEWYDLVRDKWEARAQGCGFGCYDLDLDELVRGSADLAKMMQLLHEAEGIFHAFGEHVKSEWLNSLPHREGIYLSDQPTRRFTDKVDEIKQLLAKNADRER